MHADGLWPIACGCKKCIKFIEQAVNCTKRNSCIQWLVPIYVVMPLLIELEDDKIKNALVKEILYPCYCTQPQLYHILSHCLMDPKIGKLTTPNGQQNLPTYVNGLTNYVNMVQN